MIGPTGGRPGMCSVSGPAPREKALAGQDLHRQPGRLVFPEGHQVPFVVIGDKRPGTLHHAQAVIDAVIGAEAQHAGHHGGYRGRRHRKSPGARRHPSAAGRARRVSGQRMTTGSPSAIPGIRLRDRGRAQPEVAAEQSERGCPVRHELGPAIALDDADHRLGRRRMGRCQPRRTGARPGQHHDQGRPRCRGGRGPAGRPRRPASA